MFNHKKKYSVETENLAAPEIHTDKAKHDLKKEKEEREIEYDNLAMPEIHISKTHGHDSDK